MADIEVTRLAFAEARVAFALVNGVTAPLATGFGRSAVFVSIGLSDASNSRLRVSMRSMFKPKVGSEGAFLIAGESCEKLTLPRKEGDRWRAPWAICFELTNTFNILR